ncbi:MAG: hypothetical protein ACQEQE_10580, partial [Bacillota bacterium]
NLNLTYDISFTNKLKEIVIDFRNNDNYTPFKGFKVKIDFTKDIPFKKYKLSKTNQIDNLNEINYEEIIDDLTDDIYSNVEKNDKLINDIKESTLYEGYKRYFNDTSIKNMIREILKQIL